MSPSLPRSLPLATTAVLAMLALWLGSQNLKLHQENTTLLTARDLAEIAYQTAQSQLTERTFVAESLINDLRRQLRDQQDFSRFKVTALTSPTAPLSPARAIAVWDPARGTGLLTVEKLPALADPQHYQIWITDPAYATPVNGGVFKPDPDGRAVFTFKGDQPIKTATAFAISLEKNAGVPQAEGPIVLLGQP